MDRKIRRSLAVALTAGTLTAAASGQNTLTTLYAQNNGGTAGGIVYFDLTVGASPVTITSLDVNTSATAGTAFGFTMYTVAGGYAGHETNMGDWTVQTTGSGVSAGVNAPSPVIFNNAVVLGPGTYGVGLVLNGGGGGPASHAYTNGTGANQHYTDGNLTLDAGEAENVPFTAPIFTPRVWNGTIHYTLGGTVGACCLPTTGQCISTTSANCAAQGGIYRGDNTDCSTANCPQPPMGACCLPDGTCSVTIQVTCTAQSGMYRGDGTNCSTQCLQGACCLAFGCSMVTEIQCANMAGVFHGENSTCAQSGCPTAWQEQGDAGDLPATAQVVSGNGALPAITGSTSAGDVDMYEIQICDPANFQADTVNTQTTLSDTQLFLFDSSGHGVTSDDDDPQGTGGVHSRLTAQFIPGPGLYYLAITAYNQDPHGVDTGGLIWANTPFNVERRPDGPAAAEAVGSWDTGSSSTGNYAIALSGACFVSTGPTCYANCDASTTVPFLNVNDFICFQGRFAAGDSYANCDGSTQAPVLNVNDFICFQGQFAAGCSAP